MAYDDDDRSVEDSAIAELYKFVVGDPGAPIATYYYTSSLVAVIYLGNTYSPVAIERNSTAGTNQNDPPELVVEFSPSTVSLISDNYHGNGIPDECFLTVYSVQAVSGAGIVIWEGHVEGVAIEGRAGGEAGNVAKVRVPLEIADALDSEIPSVRCQPQCNHQLGDDVCGVDLDDFDQAATVSSISGRTLVVSTVGGQPDDWFKRGKIRRTADGAVRRIVSQVGTTLTLNYPFRTLAVTNAVTLVAGCDRLILTCRDKYNNAGRFGGHPYLEDVDPFANGLRVYQ